MASVRLRLLASLLKGGRSMYALMFLVAATVGLLAVTVAAHGLGGTALLLGALVGMALTAAHGAVGSAIVLVASAVLIAFRLRSSTLVWSSMTGLEAALARRGVRVRTASGQMDPIWMLVIAGAAIALGLLVWKVVIPAFEGGVSNTGSGIGNINSGITACENNPSATCTVTTGG